MRNGLMVVVDDDKISRMLPGVLLRPYGVTVLECDSGLDALELVGVHHVGYMLIDISMPSYSGLDLLKNIQLRTKHAEIKLIAYTADAKFGENEKFRKLGFHELLIKPIHARDLLKVMGFESN